MTTAPGLIPVVNAALPAGTHVLTVGAGKEYSTLTAAINASHDGDVIRVDAGTYTNNFAIITHKITIEGMGGMVNLVATVPPPDQKGILTVDNDVTIENVSFSGAAISAASGGNGAGIRYEGGQMVLSNDSFSNNQDGILAFPVIAGLTNTITIDHSVFSANGSGTGYTHNLYVGAVSDLTVTNSIFEKAKVGHEFKSRALVNDIENNIFRDTSTGTASYDIDLPNGGVDLIKNNTIEKGPLSPNVNMVHFGGESPIYANSSLTVTGNNFINDRTSSTIAVLNQTSVTASITNNNFIGITAANIARGPATVTGSTFNPSFIVGSATPPVTTGGGSTTPPVVTTGGGSNSKPTGNASVAGAATPATLATATKAVLATASLSDFVAAPASLVSTAAVQPAGVQPLTVGTGLSSLLYADSNHLPVPAVGANHV